MEYSINERWIHPFKKFDMIRVKLDIDKDECLLSSVKYQKGLSVYIERFL